MDVQTLVLKVTDVVVLLGVTYSKISLQVTEMNCYLMPNLVGQ